MTPHKINRKQRKKKNKFNLINVVKDTQRKMLLDEIKRYESEKKKKKTSR